MMRTVAILRSLGPVDLKNIRRDSLLPWLLVLPVAMALMIRLGLPPLAALLAERFGFDLATYYPLIMGGFALITPPLVGMVVGFLLLDERDDRVFSALLVTPVPLGGYLLYRVALPSLVGLVMTLVAYPLAGQVPLGFGDLLAVGLLGSLGAPQVALFLASFAENKVAGLAVLKMLNGVQILPLVAYFLPGAWQYVVGIVPTFWPLKVFWLAADGQGYWLQFLAGLAVNGAVLALLLRRFDQVLHR